MPLQNFFRAHFTFLRLQTTPLPSVFVYCGDFIVEPGLSTLDSLLFSCAIVDGIKDNKFTVTGLLSTCTNWYVND